MRNGKEEMETTDDQRRSQIEKTVKDLKEAGEELSFEQATLLLNSMQQLVTLAINQYFRNIPGGKSNSSIKR